MDSGSLVPLFPFFVASTTTAATVLTVDAFAGAGVLVRTGAGVYTLTFNGQAILGSARVVVVVQLRQAGQCNIADTSDTVKTISTFAVDGTTATDKNFDVVAWSFPPP